MNLAVLNELETMLKVQRLDEFKSLITSPYRLTSGDILQTLVIQEPARYLVAPGLMMSTLFTTGGWKIDRAIGERELEEIVCNAISASIGELGFKLADDNFAIAVPKFDDEGRNLAGLPEKVFLAVVALSTAIAQTDLRLSDLERNPEIPKGIQKKIDAVLIQKKIDAVLKYSEPNSSVGAPSPR